MRKGWARGTSAREGAGRAGAHVKHRRAGHGTQARRGRTGAGALGAGSRGAATLQPGAATRPGSRPRYGAGLAKTRPRARGLGAAGACRMSCGCALDAPSLFLDSVLFLSHCLDTVHHKKFSKKKTF